VTLTTRLILDRDGDPTVEIETEWNHCEGVAGSLSIFAYWHLDSITARDADSGRLLELDADEIEFVKREMQPELERHKP